MDNFENQDFDEVVGGTVACLTIQCACRMCDCSPGDVLLQDNDVERETKVNKEELDYVVEESWRWAIACEALIRHAVAVIAHACLQDASSVVYN